MTTRPKKLAYDRICVDCAYYESHNEFDRCTVGRDVITGRTLKADCRHARSDQGHCGPEGSRFVVAEVVTPEKAHPRRVA